MFPLQGHEDSEALVGLQHDMMVRTYPRWREALYGGVFRWFKSPAHVR